MLQDTSARVATLHERCLASTPVTQAIAGCFMDIDRYLADYLVVFYSRRVFAFAHRVASCGSKYRVNVTYRKS
jgi:hypothetical protein